MSHFNLGDEFSEEKVSDHPSNCHETHCQGNFYEIGVSEAHTSHHIDQY